MYLSAKINKLNIEIMNPKEKAKELVDKMLNQQSFSEELYDAKQCALIAVDEILEDDMYGMEEEYFEKRIEYWQEVKEEIKKL
jgi:hypothetical protein